MDTYNLISKITADPFREYQKQAIQELARNESFVQSLESGGIPWGVVKGMLKEALPHTLGDRDSIAYNLVPTAMEEIVGPKDQAWRTERRGAKATLFIVKT
jgi:hypothetical protein